MLQSTCRNFPEADFVIYLTLNVPVFRLDMIWNEGVRRPGEFREISVPRLFFCWRYKKTAVNPTGFDMALVTADELRRGTLP